MLCVCVEDVMEVVFSVCIVRRGASFKLTLFGSVISMCCVGFASLDVVCDELNDGAWNVCL